MKVAFRAILTPLKDTPANGAAGSQIAPLPESSLVAGKPYTLGVPTAQLAPAAVENTQPPAATPVTALQGTAGQVSTAEAATQGNGGLAAGRRHALQQKNDSPETPAKLVSPAAETKIKPAAQPDDNALPAAAIVHPAGAQLFAASADSTRTSAASESSAPAPEVTPYNATAEALRSAESNLAPTPQLRTGAAQEISIGIAPPDSPAVDLRVVERAGQVHVDVRTPDAAMQTSLRQTRTNTQGLGARGPRHRDIYSIINPGTGGIERADGQSDHRQQDPSAEPRRLQRFLRRLRSSTATTETTGHLARRIGRTKMTTLPISSIAALVATDSFVHEFEHPVEDFHHPASENVFLQLLVAQLKNQDPSQPTDGTAFVTELAQFTTLQEDTESATDLDKIVASLPTTPPTTTTTTPAANNTNAINQ